VGRLDISQQTALINSKKKGKFRNRRKAVKHAEL
jgi:hypothetical protein